MWHKLSGMVLAGAMVCCAVVAQADVFNMPAGQTSLEMVRVANPDNVGEWSGVSYGGSGPDRICGAVGYNYNIGKYEVTAGQYTEFLNKVGGIDTYSLYNTLMWSNTYGCKIERYDGSGTVGDPYQYRVEADYVNRPVNYVSWGDAARFANWLHNGQPTGAQDFSTTEDGAYYLNGATTDAALLAVSRESDWKWVIPTEDEWYKAAYHKNDGVTGNYWDYPTESNTAPTAESPPGTDLVNGSANYYDGGFVDGTYYRTKVGAYDTTDQGEYVSDSPYETFDQGGNVWEWNESILYSAERGVRGGSWFNISDGLAASYRISANHPSDPDNYLGFRVANVRVDTFWTGIGGTTWSTATGLNNWKDSGGSAADYANGLDVIFDDTATGLTADISTADVTPNSLLFNNSAKDFTVQGTQGIAGSTGLTKQGTGKVTLNSVNNYTGLTTVEAGTLELDLMAQAPVFTGGGADIQGGEVVLNYTGGSNPAVTVLAALASSYATGFASGQIYSSTATSDIGLGWIDDTGASKLTIAYAMYGDANLDGDVNATDLNTVLSFYNTLGKVWNHGDFNYDSVVGAADLNTVLSYYNQSLPSSLNVSSYTLDASAIQALSDVGITVVPEPSSLILLGMAALGLFAWAWRRRREHERGQLEFYAALG